MIRAVVVQHDLDENSKRFRRKAGREHLRHTEDSRINEVCRLLLNPVLAEAFVVGFPSQRAQDTRLQ
jgi:hypothetical protein